MASNLYSQEIEYLDFIENANYSGRIVSSEQAKLHRLSSRSGGEIIVSYDGEMPDSLRTVVDVAREVWRDYMGINDNLRLNIKYENIADADVKVSVAYAKMQPDGLSYPSALYRSITGVDLTAGMVDAVLHINSSLAWCTGFGNSENPKKLLPTIIKSLGRCLGYGSSVKKDKRGNVFMLKSGKTIFDSLVFSEDGVRMSDLNNNMTQQLNNFVQPVCEYLYVLKKNPKYKIYAPKTFDENVSLKYSADRNSTMFYGDSNTSSLTVDDTTIDILKSLGWKYSKSDQTIQIKCDDIDDTGIASAYSQHIFYIKTNSGAPSTYCWTASLPLKDGGYETINSNNERLVIPAVADEDKYVHTLDGDIRVVISFSGMLFGKAVNCNYSLTLELKPHILSAAISSRTPSKTDNTYNDYTIDVRYEGSGSLDACVEEEFSSMTKTASSNVPYFTKVKFYDIDTYGNALFTIRVENKYGYDEYTIEQPAVNYIAKKPSTPELVDVKFIYDHFDYDLLRFDDNARFEVTLRGEGQDDFIIKNVPDYDVLGYDASIVLYYADDVKNIGDNLYKLSAMFDFDTDIYFYGLNKYGMSLQSDSIHTNDYITDPDIISALNQASALNGIIKDGSCYITLCGNVMSFAQDVSKVSVRDLTGRIIFEQKGNESIDFTKRKNGLYIITVQTKGNKRITKKFKI